MRRTFAVVAALICWIGLPAAAGEGYVGASYMSSGAEFDTAFEDFDPDGSGWKIFGGYNLIEYFGVEATYYDLGDFEQTSGNDSIEAEISVFDLSARGILPIGKRLELFAKIGYSNVDVEAATTNGFVTTSLDGSDWELLYAAGASLELGKRLGIRAEWESWDVADSLDAWSVGAYFRLGGE